MVCALCHGQAVPDAGVRDALGPHLRVGPCRPQEQAARPAEARPWLQDHCEWPPVECCCPHFSIMQAWGIPGRQAACLSGALACQALDDASQQSA